MGEKKWRALDHCDFGDKGAIIDQDTDAVSSIKQGSFEWIIVKDSEGITVDTLDTQTAANVQILLQTVVFVLTLLLAGEGKGQVIAQEINAILKTGQRNNQKTVIEGSKNITVRTTDTDTALNVQVAAQTLVSVLSALLVGV